MRRGKTLFTCLLINYFSRSPEHGHQVESKAGESKGKFVLVLN
jgi:hypothetical protein